MNSVLIIIFIYGLKNVRSNCILTGIYSCFSGQLIWKLGQQFTSVYIL